jgi:hypothetical protein
MDLRRRATAFVPVTPEHSARTSSHLAAAKRMYAPSLKSCAQPRDYTTVLATRTRRAHTHTSAGSRAAAAARDKHLTASPPALVFTDPSHDALIHQTHDYLVLLVLFDYLLLLGRPCLPGCRCLLGLHWRALLHRPSDRASISAHTHANTTASAGAAAGGAPTLHWLLWRLCGQMWPPPQSCCRASFSARAPTNIGAAAGGAPTVHWLLWRLCSQMPPPPQSCCRASFSARATTNVPATAGAAAGGAPTLQRLNLLLCG